MDGKIDTVEDLRVYQKGREFRKLVSRFCKTLPKEEQHRLKDQMIRASRSITANIAEGFGRQHPQENLQFCRQARGSHMEMLDHLNVALDDELMSEVDYNKSRELWSDLRGVLAGYIKYLESLCPKDRKFSE